MYILEQYSIFKKEVHHGNVAEPPLVLIKAYAKVQLA